GSRWVKRDGRPLDEVVLKARVIDRSLRPMFPDGITHEVQVINTVFSYDGQNDPDMLGMLGSTIGLAVSDIPFDGPIAGLRVGFNKENGEFMLNPSHDERDTSDLDLVVSGSGEAIVMVEAGANEIKEATMVEALVLAQENLGKVCSVIDEIVSEVGKEKVELISDEQREETAEVEELADKIYSAHQEEIRTIVEKKGRLEESGSDAFKEKVAEELNAALADGEEISGSYLGQAIDKLLKKEARKMIIDEEVRPDGRKTDEIRQIWSEVDVFPRTHGSAMFKRGATQAVTVTTLSDPSRGQLIESIEGERTDYYIHHYAMPPYASGEAGRYGFAKRREIGHGA
ncbi:MAG: polyribonucleotide nucleotidyltransferase, partial [Candidatus Pacebacteria bacterium]|nr:polyribonucleotide nucleotidyltransferase [Candidatus Paceibacterota bacterium]